mmetsp:Transcript_98267/g.177431  ORF Transcript_98267/g.177431 Transcript_98267/m.177431 type:complete len:157 (+) Transcript_98267:75-545(+)
MPRREEGDPLKRSPDPMLINQTLETLSTHQRPGAFGFSRGRRFPLARSASAAAHIGPGHYKQDSDFPSESMEQFRSGCLTRSARNPSYAFLLEDRREPESGTLKGNSETRFLRTAPTSGGPGSYSLPGTDSWLHACPRYSVPRAPKVPEKRMKNRD